ncbi:MAG: hypothetical protein ACTIJJ_14255 [Galactobacter sp.]
MEVWMTVIGAALIILAFVTLLVMYGLGNPKGRGKGQLDSSVLRLVRTVALLVAVVTAIGAVMAAIQTLTSSSLDIQARVNSFSALPEGADIDWDGATVDSAQVRMLDLTVTGLGGGDRVLLAVAGAVQAIPVVAVALLVWRVCRSALGDTGFSDRLRRGGFATALIVLVTGLLGQVLDGVASGQAAEHSLGSWSAAVTHGADVSEEIPAPLGTVDFTWAPLVAALLIAVVSEIIARVVALQRDKARLQDDVSGLV